MTQHININGEQFPIPATPWGVEIECYPNDCEFATLPGNSIGARFTRAHSARCQELGHTLPTSWNCWGDGSLSCNGREFVSPILRGENGVKAAYAACEILRGARITRECGLHLSVSIPQCVPDARKQPFALALQRAWVRVEAEVLQAMAPSRANNRFARRLSQFSRTDTELVREKYVTVRFQQYHTRRIEFRCHQGTTDARKVIEWANFCSKFVTRAAAVFCAGGSDEGVTERITELLAGKMLSRHKKVLAKLQQNGSFGYADLQELGQYGGRNSQGVARRVARGLARRGVRAKYVPAQASYAAHISVVAVSDSDMMDLQNSLPPRLFAFMERVQSIADDRDEVVRIFAAEVVDVVSEVPVASLKRQMNRIRRAVEKMGIGIQKYPNGIKLPTSSGDVNYDTAELFSRTAINAENFGEAHAWLEQRKQVFAQRGQ